jgi:hypothetical protein
VALLGLSACKDDSGGSPGGNRDASAADGDITPVEKKLTAAKGGTVEAEGVKLVFPAGALGKDTEITIASVDKSKLPDSKNIASVVYELGPDGAKFEKPVALTLDFEGKAPAGTMAVLAWLNEDDDEWVALADSAVKGQTATATTDHFTKFAVVFVFGQDGGVQTGGQCAEMDVSCGGDLVGTWDFSAECATADPKALFGEDHPFSKCDGVSVALEAELTGTITFNKDKTYEQDLTVGFAVQYSVPKSCLQGSCDGLDDSDKDGGTGVTEDGNSCVKESPDQSESDMQSGTYAIDGNELTLTKMVDGGADEADLPNQFCVSADGKTALARAESENGTVLYYTLTKK